MKAKIETDPVYQNEDGDDVLYWQLDDTNRYMECQLSYDRGTKEWVLLSNDSEVARF